MPVNTFYIILIFKEHTIYEPNPPPPSNSFSIIYLVSIDIE